jgi:hypothetical protein
MKRPALIASVALLDILAGALVEMFVHKSARGPTNHVAESAATTNDPITAVLIPSGRSGFVQNIEPSQQPTNVIMPLRSPSEFSELPEDFRKLLDSRGCRIPEPVEPLDFPRTPQSITSGDFAQSGQIDWAVICEKNDESSIVVFWGKPNDPECDSEVATAENRMYLYGYGQSVNPPRQWAFERFIEPIPSSEILKRTKESTEEQSPDVAGGHWNGSAPPEISHSGIMDPFDDKGFDIWYCSQGHWYKFEYFAE